MKLISISTTKVETEKIKSITNAKIKIKNHKIKIKKKT
jgi:hypothetical protein